jgi:hypothetical protein
MGIRGGLALFLNFFVIFAKKVKKRVAKFL